MARRGSLMAAWLVASLTMTLWMPTAWAEDDDPATRRVNETTVRSDVRGRTVQTDMGRTENQTTVIRVSAQEASSSAATRGPSSSPREATSSATQRGGGGGQATTVRVTAPGEGSGSARVERGPSLTEQGYVLTGVVGPSGSGSPLGPGRGSGFTIYENTVDRDRVLIVQVPDAGAPLQVTQVGTSSTRVDPGAAGRQLAQELWSSLPLPEILLKANPDVGLAGMDSWFWVEGYDGRVLETSRTLELPWRTCREVESERQVPVEGELDDAGQQQMRTETERHEECETGVDVVQVSVRLSPARFSWDFGDGRGAPASSLGRPYPAESDVRHAYQQSSLAFLREGGYRVALAAEWSAAYSLSGAASEQGALPPRQRVYEARHQVREAQAILAGR